MTHGRLPYDLLLVVTVGTLSTLSAGCVNCGGRFAKMSTIGHFGLAEPEPADEVLLIVTVLRIETASSATDSVALGHYGGDQWGLAQEDASGHAEWSFRSPNSAECLGAYNANWTFSLELPRKWPPEIAAAHPPRVFDLTRDELDAGVEVCLWDG